MLAIVTAGHGAAPELPRLRGVANIKCIPAFQTSNTSYSIFLCNWREHFNMRQYHCHWEAYLHKCGWCCILPSPCRVTAQHSGHLWTAAAGAATSGVMSAHLSQSPGLSGHKTSAANRLIGEVVQSPRRPLLGPSPGWKRLLALSHLRHY